MTEKLLHDTQSRRDDEDVLVMTTESERGSGCMKTQGQSLTMGLGHSKAGVIRPCAERQRQSPRVNIHHLLRYQVTYDTVSQGDVELLYTISIFIYC